MFGGSREPAEYSANMAAGRGPDLKKGLGQHHLTRPEICRPLLDFLRPSGARVLEIGPGGGVLTLALLDRGAEVIGWEIDLAWAVTLRRTVPSDALDVVVGDALDILWPRLTTGTLVAGNLPYGVATRIVLDVLETAPAVPRAAFLVQREVAERLVAGPGSQSYGSLSVMVRAYASPSLLGQVAPGAFRPPPRVDSAFVGLERVPPPLPAEQMVAFGETVRAAFSHRRKTVRNSLSRVWGSRTAAAALASAGVPPDVRAEALDLAGFVRLHTARIGL